jgi:type II restriction/modification system DNA methylase subunit YeeA
MPGWQELVHRWSGSRLGERQGAQQHFLDICAALGEKPPAHHDQTGESFTFEKHVSKALGGTGYADVWKRNFFAWEYKGPHKNLTVAYRQLLEYRDDLENPPLLVVSDFERFEVHTCWNATRPRKFEFHLSDLLRHEPTLTCPIPPQDVLRAVFQDPEQLRPEHVSAKVTEAAALRFSQLAERLELEGPHRLTGEGKIEVAHFFMRLLFCLFADSVKLLPEHLFRKLVEENRSNPNRFVKKLRGLFQAMAKPDGTFGPYDISWFNGGLFDDRDVVLDLTRADMDILYEVSRLDWSSIEPAIFGTLFERSLDSAKRKLIGAHYTSSADIRLLIEPVMMKPLRERWMQVLAGLRVLEEKLKDAPLVAYRKIRGQMEERLVEWIHELSSVRVLDPACGSGNFLYVALRELLDLWLAAARYAAERGLKTILPKTVGPHQLYGIESDFYAHQLASIVVWIGYLQWRHESGQGFDDHPVLKKLENIEHADAILRYSLKEAYEPDWPEADYIIGNPPFLGGKMLRRELGDERVDDLFLVYDGRVSAQADLVTYWFEKARALVEAGKVKRAGLLATQAIRDGANRLVLDRMLATTSIFWAQSNLPWTLEGAAVRISMVAFDNGAETTRMLDGREVVVIHADLTSAANVASAQRLKENAGLCFMGSTKVGAFELSREDGERMLRMPLNPNGRPNSDVVRPWVNGQDLTGRPRGRYIIDFGTSMSETQAALYETPFEYVKRHVKPKRVKNRRSIRARRWWLLGETLPAFRVALKPLQRYLATSRVSKHRLFVWESVATLPDSRLLAFARDDDYFCGVLNSHFHQLWSLANVSWHGGERPTYVKETCFETFPFPWPPGYEPRKHPRLCAIAAAARQLDERRDAWLNPTNASAAELAKRTLTNLYNERPQWLQDLHSRLDRDVAAAYGWQADISDDEVLVRLLDLNLERSQTRTRVPKKPSMSVPALMPANRETAVPLRKRGRSSVL